MPRRARGAALGYIAGACEQPAIGLCADGQPYSLLVAGISPPVDWTAELARSRTFWGSAEGTSLCARVMSDEKLLFGGGPPVPPGRIRANQRWRQIFELALSRKIPEMGPALQRAAA